MQGIVLNKRKFFLLITIVIFLSGLPGNLTADVYYFSSSLGNDAWSGKLEVPNGAGTDGPKASLAEAEGLINNAEPGDHFLFRCGDNFARSGHGLALISATGEEGNEVVIGSYGNGDLPIFDIDGYWQCGIFIRGAYSEEDVTKYLTIENIKFTTSSAPGMRAMGINVLETARPYNPHHITIRGVTVEGLVAGMGFQYTHDITLDNCIIKDNFSIAPEEGHSQGLYSTADNLTISNCLFDNNGKKNDWFDHNIYLSHGDSILVEGNTFQNAHDAIKLRGLTNSIVRNNVIHDMRLIGIQVGGDGATEHDAENIIIENNIIYNTNNMLVIQEQSGTGNAGVNGLVIRNNIFYSNSDPTGISGTTNGCFMIRDNHSHLTDVYIYNNIIADIKYGKSNFEIRMGGDLSGIYIRNNIFMRTDNSDVLMELWVSDALGSLNLDYNCYFQPMDGGSYFILDHWITYDSVQAFNAAYPNLESNGQDGDPMLSDPVNKDFNITGNSDLLINKGINADGIVDEDFKGNSRPLGIKWDIGPYEYDPFLDLLKPSGLRILE